MLKKFLSLMLTAAVMLCLCSCGQEKTPGAVQLTQTKNGEFAQFSAQDLNGNPVDASILKDNTLTVINIWGTYCPPCLEEMPALGELAEEYRDRGLNIIGIVSDIQQGENNEEQLQTANELIQQTGADYMHLLPSQDLYNIVLGDVSSIPFTLFVDSSGNVLATRTGAMTKAKWAEVFDYMLKYAAKD